MDSNKNIVFITDKHYLMPTTVAIFSLIHSRKLLDDVYCINCIIRNLNEEDKSTLIKLGDDKNIIQLIDADDIELNNSSSDKTDFGTHKKKSALLKFELADIFPQLDRILYLDGDIIVNSDIDELFSIELDDNYLAAVYDNGKFCSNKIPDINPEQYFNSGVMVLNLKKMRDDNAKNLLYKAKENNDSNFFMDQNAFNVVFANKAVLLSLKYNCQYVQIERKIHFNKLKIETLNEKYGESYKDWEELKSDIRIMHYTTPAKPWKFEDTALVSLWDEYYCSYGGDKKLLHRKRLHTEMIYKLCKMSILKLPLRFIFEVEVRGFMPTIRRSFLNKK